MARNIIDLRNKPGRTVRPRALPPPQSRKEKRASPLRTRRRRARLIAGGAVLLLCAVLAYGIHWLSYLPQFNVNRVVVNGAEQIQPELLRSYVDSLMNDGSYHFLSRTNILLYPRAVIEKGIVASFPRIREAKVSRDSIVAQAITVTVSERQPFAQWCMASLGDTSHSCYAMDDSGFIFAETASSTPGMYTTPYVFSGDITDKPVGKIFVPGHMPGILALLRILQQQGDLTPAGIRIDGDQDFSVNFGEGFSLKASFGQDADTLARNLSLVLSSDALTRKVSGLEYVDLRFGNRVYYKLKGEEQVSSR